MCYIPNSTSSVFSFPLSPVAGVLGFLVAWLTVAVLERSEGVYASAGQLVMALVDRDSYWIAAYFKETQLRHISTGDTAIISLMGNEDLPFRGIVRSVGWGIFVTDGSSGQGEALLPSVSPTIDWVRLPQRFPVRIQVDSSSPTELRIGQTVSVAISHGPQSAAIHNRLAANRSGQLFSSIGALR